jgi:hypothetical protein
MDTLSPKSIEILKTLYGSADAYFTVREGAQEWLNIEVTEDNMVEYDPVEVAEAVKPLLDGGYISSGYRVVPTDKAREFLNSLAEQK